MTRDNAKAAKAIARRAIVRQGGKIHRRGVNMAPAVKKEAVRRANGGKK